MKVLPAHSLPSTGSGRSREPGSRTFPLDFLYGCRGQTSGPFSSALPRYVSKELHWKCRAQDKNWHLCGMLALQVVAFHATSHYSALSLDFY